MRNYFISTLTKFLMILALSILSNELLAQTTNGIFFQAVARDNFSNPAKDRKIYVQSSIIQSTPTGIKVLTEEHQASTDATGVFSISLGNGVRVGGTATNLTTIDWSKGPFYLNLKVAITPIGGSSSWNYTKEWVDMGTTSFGAVPFALYAANAAGLDQKLDIIDTAKMLSIYAKSLAVQGLSNTVNGKLNAADTATMLAPYSKMVNALIASNITSLTAASVNAALNSKVNLVDSGLVYITPKQLAAKTFDQTPITNAIATKLNIADSTIGYVTPTQLAAKTFDTVSLSNRINLKANESDVATLTTAFGTKLNITDTSYLLQKSDTVTLSNRINLKLDANKVGVANGIATLNASGIIPSNQLPPVTVSSTSVVASEADMLALTNATVGSIAIRTDLNKNYILSTARASVLANWVELLTPGAPVQTVNGYIGSVNLSKTDIGLANVENISDINKVISNATQTALNLKLDANKLAVANGAASLNALGKIPSDQIPAISFSSVKVLNSEAAMLALSAAVVGSVVIRTDVNKNYVLAATNPAVLANWIELLTPAPPVQTVNGYTGSVSLTKSDVGLSNVENTSDANKQVSTATQTALDLKANLISLSTVANTGSYNDLLNIPTAVSASTISGTIAITNGGTGARTKNFVDLTTAQTIAGAKNFTSDLNVNGLTIGLGGGADPSNTAIGNGALLVTTSGGGNVAIGAYALYKNTIGQQNTAIGQSALFNNSNAFANVAIGNTAGAAITTGGYNTIIGNESGGGLSTGAWNTIIGRNIYSGNVSNNIIIGNGQGQIKAQHNGTSWALGTIGSGTWNGTTIDIAHGGTGATTIADARANLGLVIGANVQAPLTAGTDYLTPTGSAANLTNFPTLDQNTTGNAATATLATNATYASTATTAGNITATSNATLTSLSNLNTVGTITSGTWSATTIDIAHGGTGSTVQNFVDLSSNQNAILGTKSFSNNIVANGISIGQGSGGASSIIIGSWTWAGANSIGIGTGTLTGNSGTNNVAIGENTLRDSGPVSKNTALGVNAGANSNLGSNNTFIGYNAIATTNVSISNSTAIGSGAKIYASNTIRLGANGLDGTTAIDSVITTGTLTAGTVTYPKTHGTANQVLSTTGSGTLTWTTVSSVADASTLSGTITVAKGGTGATNKSAAFDALSPMTSAGDIIYGGLNGTGTRLGKGNNFSFLTLDAGGLPTWTNAIRATSGTTWNAAVGFSFIGGDWAKNTGMFSDNPDDGNAMLKFRITGNSKLTIDPNNVTVLANTASTSKTTGSLIVSGGLGVGGDIYASNLNVSGAITAGTWSATAIDIAHGGTGSSTASGALSNLGAASINANLNDQTGTTYTLLSSDNGKVVTLNNAAAITLTVPAGLAAGFNCMIVQKGAGLVTITPAITVTVTNRSGGTKTGGQNAIVTIISISSNNFITGGDMQ